RRSERATGADAATLQRRRRWRELVGPPYLHAPVADPYPRARPRVAGAHDPRQLRRRTIRIETELVDAELLCVRRFPDLRLGNRVGDGREVRPQQLRPDVDESRVELACGLVRIDRYPGACEHRSGVETRLDPHEIDTGLE